jgi:enoyl-[acyl-carrier-protein] reductase (NADH)
MSIKRLTKEDIRKAAGTFNPTGHIVASFTNDAIAATAADTLHTQGFKAEDILSYTSAEVLKRLREMVAGASEAAGFGYEITLMRRYLKLAEAGAGWLIIYAPEDENTEKVAKVATDSKALCAVRYGRLVNEDLV